MQDIRYKQRFENFEKSFLLLKEAISIKSPSIVEEAGVIQFFEITFELAMKMKQMKFIVKLKMNILNY